MAPLKGDPASYDLSKLQHGIEGTCLCGNIKVTINQKDLFSQPNGHVCHCLNCRRQSGGAAVNLLLLNRNNVVVEDPQHYLKTYSDSDTGSGNTIPRSFCSNCGSAVGGGIHEGANSPLAVIPLGLFPRIPKPEFELFVAHRQEWLPAQAEKQIEYREGLEEYYGKAMR